jgi:hypothetical protein
MSKEIEFEVEDIVTSIPEGTNVKPYESEIATGKKDKMKFALQYHDGIEVDSYEFEVTKDESYAIINFADDKLEQFIWGAKIDMKKEELRRWKKLNATNYRAKYPIPVASMKARFEKGKAMIIDFLANDHKKYEDGATVVSENETSAEDFFK